MKSLRYELVTAPTELPISLADVKRAAVIEHNDDDRFLKELITNATDYAQSYTLRQFCAATYDVYYDEFAEFMELPLSPVVSVDEITYTDTAGDPQVVDTAVYEVDNLGMYPSVVLSVGKAWPVPNKNINSVKIRFTAGYGEPKNVPGTIRQAITMLVMHWNENREGVAFTHSSEMPHSASAMLQRYRNMQGV